MHIGRRSSTRYGPDEHCARGQAPGAGARRQARRYGADAMGQAPWGAGAVGQGTGIMGAGAMPTHTLFHLRVLAWCNALAHMPHLLPRLTVLTDFT